MKWNVNDLPCFVAVADLGGISPAARALNIPKSSISRTLSRLEDGLGLQLFVRGSRKLAREVLEVDAKVVDGVVNLTGLLTLGSGEGLKYLETGRAQFYALIVFAGVIGLVVLFGVIGGPIA